MAHDRQMMPFALDVIEHRHSDETSRAFLSAVGILTLLLASVYMWHMLRRGWIPHDEGLLAQSAERVLSGQLPHRDFDEAYTGGLSYLNAFAFRALGTNLLSLRIMLFAFFLAWVPIFFYCASRFVGALGAAGVSLAAVAWGPPNYAAAVPSWYNLFFTTATIAALLKFVRTETRMWLGVAGLAAGMSCVFKSVGVYAVAAVLFFLVFHEQTSGRIVAVARPRVSRLVPALLYLACVAFITILYRLIYPRLDPPEAAHFLVPGTLVAMLVVVEESRGHRVSDRTRLSTLWYLLWPFGAGLVLPIALFLIPYVVTGSLEALWNGVAVEPFRRLMLAAAAPPPLIWMSPALMLAAAVFAGPRLPPRLQRIMPWLLGAALATVFAEASGLFAYMLGWQAFYEAPPVVVALGTVWLSMSKAGRLLPPKRRQETMLVLSALGLFALIQFPFSRPIYFCYLAPFLFLVVAALYAGQSRGRERMVVPVALFAIFFPVVRVTPGFVYNIGFRPGKDEQTSRLTLPRAGGIRIPAKDAKDYVALVDLIQRHSSSGQSILALPDSPEVYFLADRANPTRLFFDFLDPAYPKSTYVVTTLDSVDPGIVVLNKRPEFSTVSDSGLVRVIEERYPISSTIGRFNVRWR